MFCGKCGAKQPDGAQFCGQCGAKLQSRSEKPNLTNGQPEKSGKKGTKKKNTKTYIIILVVAIILISAIAAILIAAKKKDEKAFNDQIAVAEKYLEELDYENAEAAYLAAIKIDPKQEKPYVELAEIYLQQNEPEKAVDILEQGCEATDSEVLGNKLSLYTYVEEVLIPELGKPETGIYELEYITRDEYFKCPDVVRDQSGVINSRIRDFDQDGEDELLVAVLRGEPSVSWGTEFQNNVVYLQMYEAKNGEVELSAEMQACDSMLGGEDQEDIGIFLHEYTDKIYICGGTYKLVYMYADGSYFTSFVVTYENEDFVMYTGNQEGFMGSSFEDLEPESRAMAEKLEAIGLPRAAKAIRESWMLRMTYDDVGIDILFRSKGDNKGRSRNYWEDGKCGKLVIEFWIPRALDDQAAEEPESKVPEDVILEWEERLELVEYDTESRIEEMRNDPNADMYYMTNTYGDGNKQWTNTMNELLNTIQEYMTEDEWQQLCDEQSAWEISTEQIVQEAGAEYAGGSLGGLEAAAARYRELVARTWELFEILKSL